MGALIPFIARALLSVAAFWGLDQLAEKLFSRPEEDASDEMAAQLIAVGALNFSQVPQFKNMLKSTPNIKGVETAGQAAEFVDKLTKSPQLNAELTSRNAATTKKIFSEIDKLKAGLQKGGNKGLVGSAKGIAIFTFLLWLPGLIQQFLDQGVFNSRQSNRILDALGVPDSFRWPEDPQQFAPIGIKQESFNGIFNTLSTQGVKFINDPYKKASVPFNAGNLSDLITGVFLERSANGQTTWPNELMNIAQMYLEPKPGGTMAITTTPAQAAAAAESDKTSVYKKPKLFLGTIFSGRVGPVSMFTRQVDDAITSDADLLADAQGNLARWLETLPGKLIFKIDIKLNPVDENNVVQPGTWAVMSIFANNHLHRALLLDEILLGPMDPVVYYPEYQRVAKVTGELPDFVKYAPIVAGEASQVSIGPGTFTPLAGMAPTATTPTVKTTPLATTTMPAAALALTPPATQEEWNKALEYAKSLGFASPDETEIIGALKDLREQATAQQKPAQAPEPIQTTTPTPIAPQGNYYGVVALATDRTPFRIGPFATTSDAVAAAAKYVDDYKKATGTAKYVAWVSAQGKSFAETLQEAPAIPGGQVGAQTKEFKGGFKGWSLTLRDVEVNVDVLLVRSGPTTSHALAGSERLLRGNTFKVIGYVEGQEVNGENRWWVSQFENYVWVGGTKEKP